MNIYLKKKKKNKYLHNLKFKKIKHNLCHILCKTAHFPNKSNVLFKFSTLNRKRAYTLFNHKFKYNPFIASKSV